MICVRTVGWVTPRELRDHGSHVLSTPAAADLDAALHRKLVGTFGLDDARARAVVSDLVNHWPKEPPRGPHD